MFSPDSAVRLIRAASYHRAREEAFITSLDSLVILHGSDHEMLPACLSSGASSELEMIDQQIVFLTL